MNGRIKIAVAVVLLIVVVMYFYPHVSFQKPVYGELSGVAPTQLYYAPTWLGKLDKSPGLKDVLWRCQKDRNCKAVVFTTEEQNAAHAGHLEANYCEQVPDPPECQSEASPYQLIGKSKGVVYSPREKETGPTIYVKRGVKISKA